jgi:hypothetical protein
MVVVSFCTVPLCLRLIDDKGFAGYVLILRCLFVSKNGTRVNNADLPVPSLWEIDPSCTDKNGVCFAIGSPPALKT